VLKKKGTRVIRPHPIAIPPAERITKNKNHLEPPGTGAKRREWDYRMGGDDSENSDGLDHETPISYVNSTSKESTNTSDSNCPSLVSPFIAWIWHLCPNPPIQRAKRSCCHGMQKTGDEQID